jgi:hypothetical protein
MGANFLFAFHAPISVIKAFLLADDQDDVKKTAEALHKIGVPLTGASEYDEAHVWTAQSFSWGILDGARRGSST